jgi:hypothetical protein
MRWKAGSDLSTIFALVGVVILAGSTPASARSGSAGGTIIRDVDRDLSAPHNDEPQPPASSDVDQFDGNWLFAATGCHAQGFLIAIIAHGQMFFVGGSGRVDPDGTLNSAGSGFGITQTAVGRLTGSTGRGTFKRSTGCGGTWTGIRQ